MPSQIPFFSGDFVAMGDERQFQSESGEQPAKLLLIPGNGSTTV